eukprot:TRINITY_DN111460_c0_g1_i1.p1 TRINITY_DN111460_c0_g1~~TRINITY_DN111460_c0_g1_i1.p1  ORF type:complete len:375 (-),score=78.14 TRINITY_DN111460_c0_g1_i1:24-1121(-)
MALVLLLAAAAVRGSLAQGTFAPPKAKQRFQLQVPRVTVEELSRNDTLKSGLHAYVLHGFAEKWQAMDWTLEYLEKTIPFEWVDYYPRNMVDVESKPYLRRFEDCVQEFRTPSSSPRYMQIRLGLKGWNRLKKDFLPKPLPDVFWDDDEWIKTCMKKEDHRADKKAIDNFFVTQQWKFLLIGEEGTSMFFHKDGTAASTWQVQLAGKKKWTLCPNTESNLLSMGIDTFKKESRQAQGFAKALCGQVTVSRGELLYYPAYWWHHTLQLETPSIAYTGALVGVEADRTDLKPHTKPHARFYDDLQQKCLKCWRPGVAGRQCDDISVKWPGAAPPPLRRVCDEYLPQCLKLWENHAQTLHGKSASEEL